MITQLEDLGTPGLGDCWMTFRFAKNPLTGAEVALGSLSRGGFVVIDPKTKNATQIRTSRPFGCAWAIAQAPTGEVYQVDYGNPECKICVWDWKAGQSTILDTPPVKSCFTIDVAIDGRVYIPDYSKNTMFRFDPATRQTEDLGDFYEFCKYVRNVVCARDGIVYVTANTYIDGVGVETKLVALDPATNKRWLVTAPHANEAGLKWLWGSVIKDAAGNVLVAAEIFGRKIWHELVGGAPRAIAQERIRLSESPDRAASPLAFSDGGFITDISQSGVVSYVDPDGAASQFQIQYEESPARIFSIEVGGGKVWGGTFIPLTLFAYDIASGETQRYGNPQGYDEKTSGGGEIYSSVFLHGKLYTAAYVNGILTRLDPNRPIQKSPTPSANPAFLGKIKETSPPLQRPYGKAVDRRGMIFFAAHGGYGCIDSGIARIDPASENVTRWLYPQTDFGVMTYVKSLDQILVGERKHGGEDLLATFISPIDGSVIRSEVLVKDGGNVHSWLDTQTDTSDLVYGMHGYRATLFAYSLRERRIVKEVRELRLGTHCNQALVWGPDGRIWGLTNECVFAATPDLRSVEKITDYPDHAGGNAYRFGLAFGEDGHLYFPNGPHLMRVRCAP